MPHVATSPADLLTTLRGIAHVDGDRLVIDDEAAFRDAGIRDVAWTATFSEDAATIEAARWIVWEASQELGAPSASIHELYMARGRGEVSGFTVPAINLRTQVFDMAARPSSRPPPRSTSAPIIFELARSEQEYTFQRPGEYITSVLAGRHRGRLAGPGLRPGRPLPVQRQEVRGRPRGDDRGDRCARPRSTALAVGYGNIDIDSSTLVDLSLPTVDEQQRTNYERAAELSALIREPRRTA